VLPPTGAAAKLNSDEFSYREALRLNSGELSYKAAGKSLAMPLTAALSYAA
jgi:hypothetical protein